MDQLLHAPALHRKHRGSLDPQDRSYARIDAEAIVEPADHADRAFLALLREGRCAGQRDDRGRRRRAIGTEAGLIDQQHGGARAVRVGEEAFDRHVAPGQRLRGSAVAQIVGAEMVEQIGEAEDQRRAHHAALETAPNSPSE